VQNGPSCEQLDFCSELVQAGYNVFPAGYRSRKLLTLWRKTDLSTITEAFTITTIYVYNSFNLYIENSFRGTATRQGAALGTFFHATKPLTAKKICD
jgi:hypothetical protein